MYKVLVIDDELMIKRSLSALIQRSGTDFEVVGEAENGCEGLELARQHHPHLVLTDIRMPKLDGLELVEELNRLMPDVMTVLVSGYGEFDYAQHALRHGVFDYLLKPVKPHEVMRVLENAQNRLRQTESHRRERQDWLRVCRREGKRLADGIWNLDESAGGRT